MCMQNAFTERGCVAASVNESVQEHAWPGLTWRKFVYGAWGLSNVFFLATPAPEWVCQLAEGGGEEESELQRASGLRRGPLSAKCCWQKALLAGRGAQLALKLIAWTSLVVRMPTPPVVSAVSVTVIDAVPL